MSAREVIVRLRMEAGQYIAEATAAAEATRRLRDQQRQAGKSGESMGAGLMLGAKGLAILGGSGLALRALPPLLSATATTAGAIPGILGAIGADAIVAKVGLNGVGTALHAINQPGKDPFARLAPNAKAFVAEAGRVKSTLHGVQQGLQNRLMVGTAADFNAFATNTLPAVSDGLNVLAHDWSRFFREITASTMDPQVQSAFNTVTDSAHHFFDQLIRGTQPAAHAIATLTKSADPMVRRIGDGMTGAITRFSRAIDDAKADGSLDAFFSDGVDSAQALMSVSTSVVRIVGMVVSETNKQSESLKVGADQLKAYLDSGRGAEDIAGIVHTLTTAADGLKMAVGPLGEALRDALADPGTAAALRDLFAALSVGTSAVKTVVELFEKLPDEAQGVILAAIGIGFAYSKMATLMQKAQLGVGKFTTKLAATGPAGVLAGRGLTAITKAAGNALTALIALQAIGMIFGKDTEVDADGLSKSLEQFAKDGTVAGEAARLSGKDLDGLMSSLKGVADTGRWSDFLGGFREMADTLGVGGVFNLGLANASTEVAGYDDALAEMVNSGHPELAAKAFAQIAARAGEHSISVKELQAVMPGYTAALADAATKGTTAAVSAADAAERTQILAGSFKEASLQGKDLAATLDILNGKNIGALQGQIQLEAAYDKATETVNKYGQVTKKGTHEINLSAEGGRESITSLLGIAEAAKVAASGQETLDGNTKRATATLDTARAKIIDLATKTLGSRAAAIKLADSILAIPNKDVKIGAKTSEAISAIEDLGFKVTALPDGTFKITAQTDAAKTKMAEAQRLLDQLNGRTAVMQIRATTINMGGTNIGPAPRSSSSRRRPGAQAAGGIMERAAAGGLLQPEIAPPGTRYQWAEPQTGGEAFLPRLGNRARGRAILEHAAEWYGMRVVPMAAGGYTTRAAAAGLVNVAPAATTRPGRLDYAETYLRARDAVKSLSTALKENGRSFAHATVKGRENRSAMYSGIRAAQDAAKARYEETGSVRAANLAYDEHIRRLRATLVQQKVNATTIRSLMALAQRPTYDTRAPGNSLTNIAYAKASISAAAGVEDLRDRLSLNQVGVGLGTEGGRDNLSNILGFFETAAAAAQARYEQTHNAKSATTLYNGYVTKLRTILKQAGYSAATIASLVRQYGRITLSSNARGGVHMAAGGVGSLGPAAAYPSGDTPLYQFAEPGTGGELFLPRLGNRRRGEDILRIGAGWYGGRYVPAGGGGGGGSTTINNNLNVTPLSYNPTTAELLGYQRMMDANSRVGRRR